MSVGTIVDVSLRILRRHWASLLAIALLLVGPGALLLAATGQRLGTVTTDLLGLENGELAPPLPLTPFEVERLVGGLAAYALAALVAGSLSSIGALAISAIVVADYHARAIQAGVALRVALRVAPSAIAYMLATSAIVMGVLLAALIAAAVLAVLDGGERGPAGGLGSFLAVLVMVATAVVLVVLTMRWAPAFPAMVAEDLGWRASLRRAWHLSAGNVWRLVLVVGVGSLVASLLAAAVSQLAAILLVDMVAAATGSDPSVAATLSSAVGTVVVAPLVPVLTAVLYFDLGARRDPGPARAP